MCTMSACVAFQLLAESSLLYRRHEECRNAAVWESQEALNSQSMWVDPGERRIQFVT